MLHFWPVMETGGWMRVFCTSANTLRRRRLPIPSLARPIQRSVSSVIVGEWHCFVCVWRNLLMYLVHLIKVGLTVMKLPKGPRVAITPPKELAGQVKICNLPLFSCSRTLFLFFVLQEPLLTNFLWMSDDVLVVNWMNRIQNYSIHLRSSLQCSCSSLFLINVFQHYLGQSSFMTHSGRGTWLYLG